MTWNWYYLDATDAMPPRWPFANVLVYAHLSGPFDYNKMPLTPMGCNAQIHKKTDKRGFYSVDKWYLFTLPEHYHTHNCHITTLRTNASLTDTIQFQHKRTTNPSITHTNKVMQALVDWHEQERAINEGPPTNYGRQASAH